MIAVAVSPRIEPKNIPKHPKATARASEPETIKPNPGSKILVPAPTIAPIIIPTKPPNSPPDTADVNKKREFDIVNPPSRK